MGKPLIVGLVSGLAVNARGELQSASLDMVDAIDPLALYEGFCPNCRNPLGGDSKIWCTECHASWHVIPSSPNV